MNNRLRAKYVLPLLIIMIMAAATFFFLNQAEIYALMDKWQLLPASDHFTELYFNDYQALPKSFVKGRDATFFFTIKNFEGKHLYYPYEVYIATGSTTIMVKSSAEQIEAGQSRTIQVSYLPVRDIDDGEVTVRLSPSHQEIHFLLSKQK